MKILLISANFLPDLRPESILYHQLATEFAARGHRVTVLTGPTGNDPAEGIVSRGGKLWASEPSADSGIDVVRLSSLGLPLGPLGTESVRRVGMSLGVSIASLLSERHDISLVCSPPPSLGLAAWVLKLVRGTPFVFSVREVWRYTAIGQDQRRDNRSSGAVERFVHRRADATTVFSKASAEELISAGGSPESIHVIPSWTHVNGLRPTNGFKESRSLSGNFTVSTLAGLSQSQDIDVFLRTASELRDHSDIDWLIVGDPSAESSYLNRAQDMGLRNVRYVPVSHPDDYDVALSASDLGVATLIDGDESQNSVEVPKIMSASIPVVAAAALNSDTSRLILESRSGYVVPPGDHEALAQSVLDLINQPVQRQRLGSSGRTYAEDNLTVSTVGDMYIELFESVLRRSRGAEVNGSHA